MMVGLWVVLKADRMVGRLVVQKVWQLVEPLIVMMAVLTVD